MRSKKALSGLIAVMMIFSFVLAACGGDKKAGTGNTDTGSANDKGGDDKVYTIKVSYENNPDEPVDLAAKHWKNIVEEKSNGRLKLELYPSSQLGSKVDVIEQMKKGSNVIALADASFLMDYVPDIGILSAPYLTDNYDQLFTLTRSDWFKELSTQLQDKGLHILTSNWIYGTRHTLVDREVTKPEDFKGLKIRVPNNKLFISTIELMGATPTPMPLGDVYPALSQGIVNGVENPLPVLYGAKLHEQVKYLSLTGHTLLIAQWIGGQKFIETLPEDLLAILKETGDEAGVFGNEIVQKAEQETVGQMKEAGLTVSEVDQAAFREAVKDIYNQFTEWTPGLYDTVQNILKESK